MATDTLVLSAKKATADALRLKVRLFSANGAIPTVERVSVTYNSAAEKKAKVSAGNPANWNMLLPVPECSQMVYPDGGNVWCSPTSTSMVLGFWGVDAGAVRATCAERRGRHEGLRVRRVRQLAVQHGLCGQAGDLEAYVARFTGLDAVEPWVKAGVPVVVSYAWKKGELTGAPIPSSSGHLGVIVGFDAAGNPIVNDPAAASDEAVQRTYLRGEFEALWLGNSGGTVYLIYPAGTPNLPF